jgi:DNA-binding transcriptional regulator YiaG
MAGARQNEELSGFELIQEWQKIGKRQLGYRNEGRSIEAKHGTNISIGRVIRSLRLRRGWTQERVAVELDTNKTSVGEWERDARFPSGMNVIGLITLFPSFAGVIREIWPTAFDFSEWYQMWDNGEIGTKGKRP